MKRLALVIAACNIENRTLAAQTPPDVTRERRAHLEWLTSAATSPFAVIAQQPIGSGIRLGPPNADVPLSGVPEHRVMEHNGTVIVEGPSGRRPLPRARPRRLDAYTLVAAGPAGRATLSVFGQPQDVKLAGYYPYDRRFAFTVRLEPPDQPGAMRVLAADGLEVQATEAGTVAVRIGSTTARLRVLRFPANGDTSGLEIFFRDSTNGHGTYPAGRFVNLVPLPGGAYRLDFNRARNPYCAYSTVYACPAPWRGNTIPVPIRVGERYAAPPNGT